MSATQIPLKLSFAIVGDLSSSDTMFNCFCGEGATWPISLRGGPLMNTSSPSLCYVGPSEKDLKTGEQLKLETIGEIG